MSGTEAGRKFLDEVVGLIGDEWGAEEADSARVDYGEAISAIETEALAGERARIREAVDALMSDGFTDSPRYVTEDDLRSIIDPEPVSLEDIERIGKTMGSAWEGVVSFDDAVKRLTAKTH